MKFLVQTWSRDFSFGIPSLPLAKLDPKRQLQAGEEPYGSGTKTVSNTLTKQAQPNDFGSCTEVPIWQTDEHQQPHDPSCSSTHFQCQFLETPSPPMYECCDRWYTTSSDLEVSITDLQSSPKLIIGSEPASSGSVVLPISTAWDKMMLIPLSS